MNLLQALSFVGMLVFGVLLILSRSPKKDDKLNIKSGDCVIRSGTFMPEEVLSVSKTGAIQTSMMGVKTYYTNGNDLVLVNCKTGELL